jgi:hypothetical protein
MHPLQSPEWEEFRKITHKTSRVGEMLIVWSKVPLTPWYFGYLPKGRMVRQEDLGSLRDEAYKVGAIGIRMEPDQEMSNIQYPISNQLKRGRPFFTDKTFYLDLTKSEEQLLADMHPKARYNIKLAQKRGVVVEEDNSDAAFERYWELMEETTHRQKFYAHDKKYHQNMWRLLKEKIAHLFVAKYRDEIVTAWIVWKYGDKLYYPYGASTDKYKEVMAPSLMLWETAKWGRQNGCKIYDLWVADEGKGFTRFKQQFGPRLVQFVGTYDLIVQPLPYWIFRLLEEVRWKILKFRT